MKPLRIEVTAFGPYAGTQVFDFAELEGRSFFLIHGPTGAGKTTVLDALCFALYGDASGSARDGRGLRSDYAAADLRTEVTVDFALGGATYRAQRSPSWERPKKRGEGMTIETGDATLWRLDPGAEPHVLAKGDGKVNAEVKRLLGFESAQFRQVVVLPQGEFRKFLLADVGERETILAALFKTGRFAAVERALKDEALNLGKLRQAAVQARNIVLEQAGAENRAALDARRAECALDVDLAVAAADDARRAAEFAQGALGAGRQAKAALDERDQADVALAALEARQPAAEEGRAELEAARRAAPVVAHEADCATRESEVERANAALIGAERAVREASEALIRARAAYAAEEQREAERQAAQSEVARLSALGPKAESLRTAAVQVAQAERAQRAATKTLAETSSKLALADERLALEASAHADALREAEEKRWERGQAFLLAKGLRDGAPCPVCGSTEHPQKAEETPTAAAAARADEPNPSEAALARVEALAKLLSASRARRETLDASRLQHDAATHDAAAECAAARARLQERESELPEALRAPEALSAALHLATAQRDALDAALERARVAQTTAERDDAGAQAAATSARGAVQAAAAARDAASLTLDEAIGAAGFADRGAWRVATRTPDRLTQLEANLRQHDDALASAHGRAERARTAAAPHAAPDLAALEGAAGATSAARDDATGRAASCRATHERLERAATQLSRYDLEHAELEARYGVVGRLAEVADGTNPHRLSFQRYVLATLLDDVLLTSTQRLRDMSRGRYELQRRASPEGGGRKGGLALDVMDHHTGLARPVNTLSGGESFLASLCLALGLADVLQSYAGGVRLDTIFVDEGFGTLDQDALEQAIDTLIGLQAGGRLVGVISHVPELRERVDARLEILRGARGSTARFVVG